MIRFIEFPTFLISPSLLVVLLTYATVLLQLMLPIFLWRRQTRMFGILLGTTFHLTIDLFLVVGFFAPLMVVLYLSFLDADQLRGVGKFRDNSSGEKQSSVGTVDVAGVT
jgi:hypothetical protein